MVLRAREAASVNLPGAVTYPPYEIRPTHATRGGAPVNPMYLSFESEARALMAELGGTGIVDDGINVFAPVYYPADEPRRMWSVTLGGGRHDNAGGLLRMRNAMGVGAPGRWRDSQGVLAWVSDPPAPTGLDDSRAAVDIPVRALLPNEELRTGAMGFGLLIHRTDLEQESLARSGGFTAEDRRQLGEVYRIVSKLGI